ncbi:hypothetical protein JW824_05000 [bacterium]|nr:hypothetical protein [bacterium]RQV96901.1 MAG: SGNH/GDSL hydrolase family protein [bacterium]
MEKEQGVYRIFYIGDSSVQGVVPYEENMVEIVESKLNEIYSPKEIHIEVINTGTSSYSTLLYYLLIKEHVFDYSPDLIVVNIDMTDIPNDEIYRHRLMVDEHGYPTAVLPSAAEDRERFVLTPRGTIELSIFQRVHNFLFSKMLFYRLLSKLLSPVANISEGPFAWLPWHSEQSSSADWLSHEWNETINQNVGFSMNIIKLIAKLVREHDVKMMLTSVPHYPQFSGTWSSKPHDVLEELANELQIPYLNGYTALYPSIKDSEVEEFYWVSDPTHFNIKGNSIWAEAQIQFLLDHRNTLLPDALIQSNTQRDP